jgi:hypothetical protein
MKLVRIVSETPSDAADLIFFLESHGFVIQTGQVQDPSQPLADFEIDLRVLPVDDALHLAREMASGEVDVLIGPGALVEPKPLVETQPLVEAEPFVQLEPETFVEPFVEAEPELAATFSQAEYGRAEEELAVHEFTVEELTTEEIAIEEVTVPAEEQPTQPAEEPEPVISSRRLRESIGQVLAEAGLTARECLVLCSAELLNGSEHARQWLSQARVLAIRKRALVETRAIRARAIVENKLRFDSTSQNAWIRSAFAGAGLMIVLLAMMIWKDQRFAPAGSGSPADSSAASVLKPAPSGTRSVEAGTSTPVTAGLHRRLSSDRADLVDDREVVIRHFARPTPKRAAVIDAKSGIKHISDMN